MWRTLCSSLSADLAEGTQGADTTIPMSGHSATAWLDTVLSGRDNHPDSAAAGSSPHSKRRRLQPPTPQSPRPSIEDGTPVALGLERPTRHLIDTHEHEQTAARQSSSPSPALPREDDEPETSDETSSIGSRDDEWWGVKEREIDKLDPLPPSLEALLKQIRQFSDGIGILPTSARRRFNKLEDEDMQWAKSNKHYSKERQTLGEIVLPGEVRKIVCKHSECGACDSSSRKAALDMGVNSRVLDLAFERPDGYMTMSNSLWITQASVLSNYSHYSQTFISDDEMADFCIYLELDGNIYGKERNEIDRLYDTKGTQINHTFYGPLMNFPLALSINTKGRRSDLGKWESARWACLQDLMRDCTVNAWECDPKPCLPQFLPAILVDIDNWYLVVTTYKNKKTTVWHQIKMGSTSSEQGIYQIIACLHLLRQWAEDVFWPWLSDLLLFSRPRFHARRNKRSFGESVERYFGK